MAQLSTFQKWLRLKKYHFELSVGIYMMQPGEKLAICTFPLFSLRSPVLVPVVPFFPKFPSPGGYREWTSANTSPPDSIFFLLFSLTFIAVVLYLPHHISFILGRAWFYINGEHIDVGEKVKEMSASVLQETSTATGAVTEVVKETAETMVKEL